MGSPADSKKKSFRWRTLVRGLLILFTVGLATTYTTIRWINAPIAQQKVVRWINQHTDWQLELGLLKWSWSNSALEITGLKLHHLTNNNTLTVQNILIDYNPWPLLWGTLQLDNIAIKGLNIQAPVMASPTTTRRRIKLRKLLLLRHLIISRGTISPANIVLPKKRRLTFQSMEFSFTPELFRSVHCSLSIKQPLLQHKEQTLAQSALLVFSGATTLGDWVNVPPYINNARGALSTGNLQWRNLSVNQLSASAELFNSKIALNDFTAIVKGSTLHGDGFVEISSQESGLTLEWPDPIPLPELLPKTSFMLMAGSVRGKVSWQGKGFSPAQLNGSITADIHHIPNDVAGIPAHLSTSGKFHQGQLQLTNTSLTIGDGKTDISGYIDLGNKDISLELQGHSVPIAGVLRRFRDPNFHPIEGLANCAGRFHGWARNYTFDLKMDSVGPVTYQGISIEELHSTMHLTWPQLHIEGTILQHGQTTGEVKLDLKYGKKLATGKRLAVMDLRTKIAHHQLGPSFSLVGLTGIGQLDLTIKGVTTNYRGSGTLEINKGSFQSFPIEHLTTSLQLKPAQISFIANNLIVGNFPASKFVRPLVMNIDHGFRMTGRPIPGWKVDLGYTSGSKEWRFNDISYHNGESAITVKGRGKAQAWNLQLDGNLQGTWLSFIPWLFRDGYGSFPVHLKVRGDLAHPLVDGVIGLKKGRVIFRDFSSEWDELQGKLIFKRKRINFEHVSGLLGYGPFILNGWMEHNGVEIPRFDLTLQGKSLSYVNDQRDIHIEFDTNTRLVRSDQQRTTISGEINLVDAIYSKDFNMLRQATHRRTPSTHRTLRDANAGYDRIRLNLQVRSRGDVQIRNNAANIGLRADISITGTMAKPKVHGSIEATEGTIHYLGLLFDLTGGSVELPPNKQPTVEFRGEQTIASHLIRLTLIGPIDNLRIDLSSSPGEDRKNILCLIAYGSTCDQLQFAQFGTKLGPGIFMEQIGHLLERPLSKATGIDIVRVESASGSTDFSRLSLGKRISDRFELNFITSVGQTATEQSVEAVYKITDSLLLKARQSTRNSSQFNLSLRLREK